jgi:hypothetical protein
MNNATLARTAANLSTTTAYGSFSEFAARHWVIGGIAASLLWFVTGRQSFSRRHADVAIGEQCVAVLIVLIVGGWAAVKGQWLGLIATAVVLYFEVRSIARIPASRN